MRELTISGKKPLCPWCRNRHLTGQATAYFDDVDDLWRCARCHHPIDVDGECNTDNCCGYMPPVGDGLIRRSARRRQIGEVTDGGE